MRKLPLPVSSLPAEATALTLSLQVETAGGVSTCFYYGKRSNIKSRNRGTLDRVELWLELLCWPLALLLLRIATLRCLVDFPGWEK